MICPIFLYRADPSKLFCTLDSTLILPDFLVMGIFLQYFIISGTWAPSGPSGLSIIISQK
jgi:hypothetical protein